MAAEGLRLRPVLARGRIPGLETVPGMGRRLLGEGHVAGVNGGFWLTAPVGDPNGYFALDGALLSEPETQGEGPRGTFALTGDGTPVLDRLDARIELAVDGVGTVGVAGINRGHRAGGPYPDPPDALVYVYTAPFGAAAPVRGDLGPVTALTIDGLVPAAVGTATGSIGQHLAVAAELPIPADGALLVAYGQAAGPLASAVPGAGAALTTTLTPLAGTDLEDWAAVETGLAAGPLLLRDGEMTDPAGWFDEGFTPETHSNVRHPRSAVGVTADGRVLLVTVDGRQPGWSAGMTLTEVARWLASLGVVDALSLDGGGSTQIVTDGRLRNRPCCDDPLRPVATGLFVDHAYEFAHSDRLAGDRRSATAAAIAAASHPDGADEVVLASGEGFADALAGGPLAAELDAPLLLVTRDELPEATDAALGRLSPSRVTLLGGTAVISAELEALLASRYEVRRLAGRDRIETAAAVAQTLGTTLPQRAVVATAGGYADALAAAAPAGMLGIPVLLTAPDRLPPATREALRELDPVEVVVVGGREAVSDEVVRQLDRDHLVVTRLAGRTRYATARAVQSWARTTVLDLDPTGLFVARGDGFADALAGGPLAARRRQLLAVVPPVDVTADPDASAALEDAAGMLEHVTLLGGHTALSSYQHWQLDRLAAR